MDTKEKKFITKLKESVRELNIDNIEDVSVDKVVRKMEKEKNFRVREYEKVRNYFRSILYYMEDTKEINEDYTLSTICEHVITKIIERRRERERKLSKVDTNIITHAPYFVGGGKKRKAKAREEGYVILEKGGLRTVTYENDLGEFLTMPDAQVLFALFSLWENQGYQEWVTFTEYQIIKLVGLGDGGRQYQLVRDSLTKLWNTSIVMQEAYDVVTGRKEVTQRFKLIVEDKVSREFSDTGDLRSKRYEIRFSDNVRKSIEGRYYTLISLAIFNELELNISQGLYLMVMGLHDMDNNSTYIRDDGSVCISTEEVYNTLYLESAGHRNKAMVERGCEELKEVGVIDTYYFNFKGRSADSLVIIPSEWLQEVIKRTNMQEERLKINKKE